MKGKLSENRTAGAIVINLIIAAVSLFVNGIGVYLTMHANIGAGPWDVFNLGFVNLLSKAFPIEYGAVSITVSIIIILIDIALREPIGIVIIVDAVVVGKTVDLCNFVNIIPKPNNIADSVFMLLLGLVIMGYTQVTYMMASLGCGPRDTLLVGLKKKLKKVPIGVVGIMIQGLATLIGFLLGGPVGIGTVICAFGAGPIMQFAFFTVRFDATKIRHQNVAETFRTIFRRRKKTG